jgi:hypothetical protein
MDHYSSTTKLYSWHYALGQLAFSWHPSDGEVLFITPDNVFTLFQNPIRLSFTPLQLKLDIAHGDLRLVCCCSAIETHFMMLPKKSYCADIASRGRLELGSERCNPRTDDFYAVRTSALSGSVL